MNTVDPSKIKPVPIQKTLILVNNFVVNSCNFLNQFSEVCEKKISVISSKVTDLEILLGVLEAKLNSIPGLEYDGSELPSAPAAAPAAPPADAQPAAPPPPSGPAPPPPAGSPPPPSTSTDLVVAEPQPEESSVPEGMVPAKDHPDYAPFFKLTKVGVPPPVIMGKMTAAGLNGDLLDTPDELIPLGDAGAS
jgi:WASH complex subunit CCDC53